MAGTKTQAASKTGIEEPANQSPSQASGSESVSWTASEFIAHDKSAGWYFMLALATLALAALIFLITKDRISVAVVVVAGLLLGIYGSHQPRQLEYRVDQSGITIGGKQHGYHEFRSFSVAPEGGFAGITFMPLKRFAAPITIYYAAADEDKIMAVLSTRLPFEEYHADAIDNLMRRIRF